MNIDIGHTGSDEIQKNPFTTGDAQPAWSRIKKKKKRAINKGYAVCHWENLFFGSLSWKKSVNVCVQFLRNDADTCLVICQDNFCIQSL